MTALPSFTFTYYAIESVDQDGRVLRSTTQLLRTLHGIGTSPVASLRLLPLANYYILADVQFPLNIAAFDANGSRTTNYTGTVRFTSSDPLATLPANYTFTAGENGTHDFTAILGTPGIQTITATDTITGSIVGTATLMVTYNSHGATYLQVNAPTHVAPGATVPITVTARDQSNAPASGYLGTVHFSSPTSAATVPADYTFKTADHGTHTFFVSLSNAVNQTFTVADTRAATLTNTTTLVADQGVPAHFQESINLAVGLQPKALVVGDFNGDGQQDFASANSGSNNVSVFLGDGTGEFTPAPGSPVVVGSHPEAMAVGDFDRDGRQDLIVANMYSNTVSILLGNGLGGFALAGGAAIAVNQNPQSVAIADFDGDGKLDFAVGYESVKLISVYLGNGNGTFQPAVTSPLNLFSTSFVVADLDRDGRPDLVTANSTSLNATVLLGNGNGSFRIIGSYATNSPAYALAVAVADVNRDGLPDVVVANGGSFVFAPDAAVSVLLGNGNGTLQTAFTFGTGEANTLAVADFNRDGIPDIISADEFVNVAKLMLGNGDGSFQAPIEYAVGSAPLALAVADLNRDGKPDFVVANTGNGSVSLFLQESSAPHAVSLVDTGISAVNGITGLSADFDRDGKLDVVASGGSYLVLVQGHGDGTFVNATLISSDGSPSAVAVGDFNNDGKLDLSVVNNAQATMSVLLGNGDLTFQPAVSYATSGSFNTSVAVGDFDRDGKQDLAVTNFNDNAVSVYLGNGDGTFRARVAWQVAAGSPGPTSVVVGDFNGDGKQDLATANLVAGNVSLRLGNGDGTFQNFLQTAAISGGLGGVTGGATLAAADLNRDGRLDLAILGSNGVNVLFGNGNGTFAPAVQFNLGTAPQAVRIADLNRNGAMDLIVAANTGGVLVLTNNGDGTFAPFIRFANPASYLAVGDFNRDGTQDLATPEVLLSKPLAARFEVSAYASAYAGDAFLVTVRALDAASNPDTDYRGTFHFTSSDGLALLPADYTFSAADAGEHTFVVTLNQSGVQVITATDNQVRITSGSASVNVTPREHFRLDAQLAAIAGEAITVTINALDLSGNPDPGYTGSVQFLSSDNQAILPADFVFTSADNGSHTFTVTLKTAGVQAITALDSANHAINGVATMLVSSASASALTLSDFPDTTTAGDAHDLTVTARDAFGNIASGYRGTLHFASDDIQAVLPVGYTFTEADAGVHTFVATLLTAGSHLIEVGDSADGSLTASMNVNVDPQDFNALHSFTGLSYLTDPAATVPPDTMIAVGPDHVVEVVNRSIAIFAKQTGTQLLAQPLTQFFSLVSPSSNVFDPSVIYNDLAGRFVIIADEQVYTLRKAYILFAVSNTSNPLDGFSEMQRIEVTQTWSSNGEPLWGDFPRIGWNADAYVVSMNMFTFSPFPSEGGDYAGVQLLTINRGLALDADRATKVTYLVNFGGIGNTAVPAAMHDSVSGDPLWLVESVRTGDPIVHLVKVSNLLSAAPRVHRDGRGRTVLPRSTFGQSTERRNRDKRWQNPQR